jgi:hypothetical protein
VLRSTRIAIFSISYASGTTCSKFTPLRRVFTFTRVMKRVTEMLRKTRNFLKISKNSLLFYANAVLREQFDQQLPLAAFINTVITGVVKEDYMYLTIFDIAVNVSRSIDIEKVVFEFAKCKLS